MDSRWIVFGREIRDVFHLARASPKKTRVVQPQHPQKACEAEYRAGSSFLGRLGADRDRDGDESSAHYGAARQVHGSIVSPAPVAHFEASPYSRSDSGASPTASDWVRYGAEARGHIRKLLEAAKVSRIPSRYKRSTLFFQLFAQSLPQRIGHRVLYRWRGGFIKLITFLLPTIALIFMAASSKSDPMIETLPLSVAQERFRGDPVAMDLLNVIEEFSDDPDVRVANPVMIVESVSPRSVPVLSGGTIYLTPIRVMAIGLAAHDGTLRVEDAPLYFSHSEFDAAIAAIVGGRPDEISNHLSLLRHLMKDIRSNDFLPNDLVGLDLILKCAGQTEALSRIILKNAQTPEDLESALSKDNPLFIRTLPPCLQ